MQLQAWCTRMHGMASCVCKSSCSGQAVCIFKESQHYLPQCTFFRFALMGARLNNDHMSTVLNVAGARTHSQAVKFCPCWMWSILVSSFQDDESNIPLQRGPNIGGNHMTSRTTDMFSHVGRDPASLSLTHHHNLICIIPHSPMPINACVRTPFKSQPTRPFSTN